MFEHHDTLKNVLDWIAGLISVSTIVGMLPFFLALPSAIYACLRIYDWIEARKAKRGNSTTAD